MWKFHLKKKGILCHVDIGALLCSPRKAPHYLQSKGKIWHMKSLLWTLSRNSKRYGGAEVPHNKTYTRETLYPTPSKSRPVRSHECLPGLWLQGSAFSLQQISLGFLWIWATACQEDALQHQPLKSHIFLSSPCLSDRLSSSSCLGQPFHAAIKKRAGSLPWEFGAATLQKRPRER